MAFILTNHSPRFSAAGWSGDSWTGPDGNPCGDLPLVQCRADRRERRVGSDADSLVHGLRIRGQLHANRNIALWARLHAGCGELFGRGAGDLHSLCHLPADASGNSQGRDLPDERECTAGDGAPERSWPRAHVTRTARRVYYQHPKQRPQHFLLHLSVGDGRKRDRLLAAVRREFIPLECYQGWCSLPNPAGEPSVFLDDWNRWRGSALSVRRVQDCNDLRYGAGNPGNLCHPLLWNRHQLVSGDHRRFGKLLHCR